MSANAGGLSLLAFERFSLSPKGPTLNFSLGPGKSVAIMGPAAAGKSRLIRCIRSLDKPAQGVVKVCERVAACGQPSSKRSKPRTLAKRAMGGNRTSQGGEALSICGLWEVRSNPLSSLTSSQLAACELLPCFRSDTRLMVIDGQLDRLDPWTLGSVMSELRNRIAVGAGLVVATNRPELLPQFDFVIVLDQGRALYAGAVDTLLRQGPEIELEVGSNRQKGVLALVEPFRIGVIQEAGRVMFRAVEGQEITAKLLVQGYGDVEYVVTKPPTPEQSLLHLTKTKPHHLKTR